MRYAGMFKDCYVDQVWVGCSGRYDHSDRWLLIFGITIGIAYIIAVYRKYRK